MKKCRLCDKDFKPSHGNQAYCCQEHKDFRKAENQQKIYALVKEFRKGFINNYKLFERLLGDFTGKSFSLSQLTAEGFKPHCYYGKSENDKKQVFYWVAEYSFSLYSEKAIQYVKIFKN